MLLTRLGVLALLLTLAGCAESSRPAAAPPFDSSMPALKTRFSDLDEKAPARDACVDLAAAATFTFADTADGAAIALTPRAGHARADVLDAATRVERTFLPGVFKDERASCRLFTKSDEVNVHLADGASGLRLLFETFDPEKTAGIKARVKGFVAEHAH